MESWINVKTIIAFLLGVMLSASVKGLASRAKGAAAAA